MRTLVFLALSTATSFCQMMPNLNVRFVYTGEFGVLEYSAPGRSGFVDTNTAWVSMNSPTYGSGTAQYPYHNIDQGVVNSNLPESVTAAAEAASTQMSASSEQEDAEAEAPAPRPDTSGDSQID